MLDVCRFLVKWLAMENAFKSASYYEVQFWSIDFKTDDLYIFNTVLYLRKKVHSDL